MTKLAERLGLKHNPEYLYSLMQEALIVAQSAAAAGDVPVGAVMACGGKVIARAHNEMEAGQDATRHAEMLVIQRASKVLADWRLTECILCVTLEPCTMCLGAIKVARIPVVVYGAVDEKMGACGSLFDLTVDSRLGPVPRVIAGIEAESCARLLKDFFKAKRSRSC